MVEALQRCVAGDPSLACGVSGDDRMRRWWWFFGRCESAETAGSKVEEAMRVGGSKSCSGYLLIMCLLVRHGKIWALLNTSRGMVWSKCHQRRQQGSSTTSGSTWKSDSLLLFWSVWKLDWRLLHRSGVVLGRLGDRHGGAWPGLACKVYRRLFVVFFSAAWLVETSTSLLLASWDGLWMLVEW